MGTRILISIVAFFSLTALPASAEATNEALKKAIDKTLVYLENKKGRIMPMMISTLDYLNRTYGLKVDIAQQKAQLLIKPPKRRRALMRFMDERFIVPEYEIRNMEGIDAITASALYCDIYELPKDFFSRVNAMTEAGGYSLTHATLALTILKQRGCKYPAINYDIELKRYSRLLGQLIEKKGAESDVGTEAIVFLYLSGHGSTVKHEWIKKIIGAQKPQGGCGNNDHTTVLALWAMLEAQRQSMPAKLKNH